MPSLLALSHTESNLLCRLLDSRCVGVEHGRTAFFEVVLQFLKLRLILLCRSLYTTHILRHVHREWNLCTVAIPSERECDCDKSLAHRHLFSARKSGSVHRIELHLDISCSQACRSRTVLHIAHPYV